MAADNILPTALPGEDRAFGGSTLFVDLVPQTAWFTNVRSAVSRGNWDRIRKHVYARAGNKCEVCGVFGRLEAHERWEYDETNGVQRLRRLIALCPACHEATHFGLAQIRGNEERALKHLMKVNHWTRTQALAHVDEAFEVWQRRSRRAWSIDLSPIKAVGILVKEMLSADERAWAAERRFTETPNL